MAPCWFFFGSIVAERGGVKLQLDSSMPSKKVKINDSDAFMDVLRDLTYTPINVEVLQLAIERDAAEPFDSFEYAFEWITWTYAQKLQKGDGIPTPDEMQQKVWNVAFDFFKPEHRHYSHFKTMFIRAYTKGMYNAIRI